MSTINGRDEGCEEKTRDRYFEAFKHMTTLNTAGALVLLAIYREGAAVIVQVFLSMAGFGISLLLSLYGMYLTTAKEDIEAKGYRVRWSEYALLAWALRVFFLGVGAALIIETFRSALALDIFQ
jgi:hypothetical protein